MRVSYSYPFGLDTTWNSG
uniref:Uncharacterized protein n=1 Tax=Rhizophora mucronata TaxID=61149 RepID=A0A2P2N6U5_RHIMU